MRVRRHHNHAVALLRQFEIIDKAAAAGNKSRVLDPQHGLTDTELIHTHLLVISSSPAALRYAGAEKRYTHQFRR